MNDDKFCAHKLWLMYLLYHLSMYARKKMDKKG